MNIYEFDVTLLNKKDTDFRYINEMLGSFIHHSMLKDEKMKTLHKTITYKFYVFNHLYPIEKNGVYKRGKIYSFQLRTLNEYFAAKMQSLLKNENQDFFVIQVQKRKVKSEPVLQLTTVNPVIVTMPDNKPWLAENSILTLTDRLHDNLEKKYNALHNTNHRAESCIKRIEILSKKPFPLRYKNITMLGYKLRIDASEDAHSQSLMQIALAAGMGEKNSVLGTGYCLPTIARAIS